jgi:solute carrier family 13 (sodium-dependent dicarboxylate transporter), member 2/3/5
MKRINIHLFIGPLLGLAVWLFADLAPGKPQVTAMAAVTVWMAWWWMSEAVHMAVTALLPILLLPLLGIASAKTVAQSYMDDIIFLFIGGFLIAFAFERWNLHKRIALKILMAVGTKPDRILLGVMVTAYLISMWVSNTATVMMLITAVFAIIHQIEEHVSDEKLRRKFATGLLIGLAYSASIGGMATLVGTPTNMIFLAHYTKEYPMATDINFLTWMKFGLPVSLLLLVATWFILRAFFVSKKINITIDKTYFNDSYRLLGKMGYEEKVVFGIFLMTVVLWFTRSTIDFGGFKMHGWENLFTDKSLWIQDCLPAILAALMLFLWPARKEKSALITWNDAEKLPFDIILVFGSGFALSAGFKESGLKEWLEGNMTALEGLPYPLLILCLAVIITLISEFASNVTCIQLVLQILSPMHRALGMHPLSLYLPATLASSLGFMLPVATAPNTIVFSSKRIRTRDMYLAGFFVDLVGILLVTGAALLL